MVVRYKIATITDRVVLKLSRFYKFASGNKLVDN